MVVLASATVEPDAASGPPVNPVPVAIEIDCNAVVASARSAMVVLDNDIVPLTVIGPPTKPVPVATLVTVPPLPGDTAMIWPWLLIVRLQFV